MAGTTADTSAEIFTGVKLAPEPSFLPLKSLLNFNLPMDPRTQDG